MSLVRPLALVATTLLVGAGQLAAQCGTASTFYASVNSNLSGVANPLGAAAAAPAVTQQAAFTSAATGAGCAVSTFGFTGMASDKDWTGNVALAPGLTGSVSVIDPTANSLTHIFTKRDFGAYGTGAGGTSDPYFLLWDSGDDKTTGAFRLSFNNPVYGFGFYGTDGGDVSPRSTYSYRLNGTGAYTAFHGTVARVSGNLFWWGIISDKPIESIDIQTSYAWDRLGMDDWTVVYDTDGPSEVVPEPATMTLLATGLVGMAAARRRRREANG
ncbi:MAG TPA: PEP-CTERM sorting domain-containing protein [Gemmatimonadales bacterium]|nr:PEP-CTERM sorting domain-containing protein [Gemmatimonadales bacterium]